MNFIKRLFRRKQPDLLSVSTVSDTQSRPKAAPSDSGVASDSTILSPNQDVFGIDPFAMTLAGRIAKVDVKDGVVFAINGAWGSGKSSAVNLVVHHLGDEFRDKDIIVVTFNPWWFSDAEALTRSFFQELHGEVRDRIVAHIDRLNGVMFVMSSPLHFSSVVKFSPDGELHQVASRNRSRQNPVKSRRGRQLQTKTNFSRTHWSTSIECLAPLQDNLC
jgi:hypothetical protein